MEVDGLADVRERLYAQPLDSFVAERDALAKQVRAAGDRALANEIKAFRKPSAIAAEVNQIVRADPGGVELILQAAALLRAAQEGSLDGAIDAFALQTQYRAAIQALAQSAPNRRAEIRAALEAATIDEASNDALRAGCLVVVPTPVSTFGGAVSRAPAATDGAAPAVVDELAERRAKRRSASSSDAKQGVKPSATHETLQRQNEAKARAAEAKAAKQKAEREQKRRRLQKAHRSAARAHQRALDDEQSAAITTEHAERELADADAERASLEQALAAAVERQAQAAAALVAATDAGNKLRERTAKSEAELDELANQLAAIAALEP